MKYPFARFAIFIPEESFASQELKDAKPTSNFAVEAPGGEGASSKTGHHSKELGLETQNQQMGRNPFSIVPPSLGAASSTYQLLTVTKNDSQRSSEISGDWAMSGLCRGLQIRERIWNSGEILYKVSTLIAISGPTAGK